MKNSDYCQQNTIPALIKKQSKYKNKIYTIDSFSGESFSYEGYDNITDQIAKSLKMQGVAKGEKICIIMSNSLLYIMVTHGIQKAGASAILMNTQLKNEEINIILKNSNPNRIILDRFFKKRIKSLKPKCPVIFAEDFVIDKNKKIRTNYSNITPNDAAFILYTSGSTGKQKGVVLSHLNIIQNARELAIHNKLLGLRGLNVQPSFYTDGQTVMILAPMISGGSVVQTGYNVNNFWEKVEKYHINYSALVPVDFVNLLSEKKQFKCNIDSLKFILSSAAPLPSQIQKEFENRFKIPLVEGYGLTEATSYSTCNLPTPKEELSPGMSDEYRKVGSVGKSIGNKIRIISTKTGKDIGVGKVGEVIVKGKNVMKEYLNNKTATKETLKMGWLYTGDLGLLDKEGYLYIKGRKKDMILYGGQNVFAKEVENVIYKHPNIKLVAVIPVPDMKWGETIKAVIVLNKKTSEKEIINFCKRHLAEYKCPKKVQFVKNMPISASGKILKPKLKKMYGK